jgi:hypothetical protein
MIERLQTNITHYENRRDLNQSSNHISIFTFFTLKIEQTFVKEKKAWKKINSERLTFCLRVFVVSAFFNNVNDIETFVKKIQFSVQSIIQKAIFMIKELKRAQFFWNFKCSKVVTTIKKRRKNDRFYELKNIKKHIWNSSTSKKNHRQEKEIKIQKNLSKVYSLNDVILTSCLLSENAESQIEKIFQSFELDSKKQFEKNNTNC